MYRWTLIFFVGWAPSLGVDAVLEAAERPRVLVTTDGEIDDECSLVRFLLYSNEWDVEGIITSSSQYHWQGHKWAGDDWAQPYLEAYARVYPNLIQHDRRYPTPELLQSRTLLGNVKAEGEMDEVTAGSQRIAEVLLDDSDPRPVWIQAWGGTNTIARALKSIEEEHPQRMAEVANMLRFYFIWEQDNTYQSYIHPRWGKFGIPTIISDQFLAIAYDDQRAIPEEMERYFSADWMKENLLRGHGPLLDLYKAHEDGHFRSEGDSPAFLHTVPTGLRSTASPDWGGWGGRFVRVRDNVWLDPVSEMGYRHPEGRWFGSSAWGRLRLKERALNDAELIAYFQPQWRWIDAFQNDFAARADWCVKTYEEANHPPMVGATGDVDKEVRAGEMAPLSVAFARDPDGDRLTYRWWRYDEADSYQGAVELTHRSGPYADIQIPADAQPSETIHIICQVTDDGAPPLSRYGRFVLTLER